MDRDTAARALADAYTASRLNAGMTPDAGHALDAGRFMERWLHEHGFRVVEGTTIEAVPGQQFLPDGSPIEWAADGGPTMAEYDAMDAQDYAEMREAGQFDDEEDA